MKGRHGFVLQSIGLLASSPGSVVAGGHTSPVSAGWPIGGALA